MSANIRYRGGGAKPAPDPLNIPTPSAPPPVDTRTQDELIASPSQRHHKPYNDDPTLPLYRRADVPHYLQDNQYILAGYRAYYTARMCLGSLFRLHNETFNIWTHLLGAVIFVAWSVHFFVTTLLPDYEIGNVFRAVPGAARARGSRSTTPRAGLAEGRTHRTGERSIIPLALFGFFSFASLLCMMCSAFFHTFLAHLSEPFFRWAHSLDYFGITVLIVGSFYPVTYYLFSCQPVWRGVYTLMCTSFGVIGALGPFFRHWTAPRFSVLKVLFYVVFVGSGALPTIHLIFLPADNTEYVLRLLGMLLFYGLGVSLYAFKFPEVLWPGAFDTYFSSHQLFHVCVVIAAAIHFHNSIMIYKNFDQVVC